MSTDQKEAYKKEILDFRDQRDVNEKTCYECKYYDPETGYYQEIYPRCKLGRDKEVFDRDGCEQREFEPHKYVGDETLETVVELCGKRDAEIAKLREALGKAMNHINWLAVDSVKYKGSQAWMSAAVNHAVS